LQIVDISGAGGETRTPNIQIRSLRVGKQGQTATNKYNNISKMIALHYCHISLNIACFCKLMAQNWHKNFPLMRTWN